MVFGMKRLPAPGYSLLEAYLLEKEMAAHSSILAGEILWTEELGGLQSIGSQRVGYNLATKRKQQQPVLCPITQFTLRS